MERVDITSIALDQAGLYYCQTEDAQGERHRREIHVYVKRTLLQRCMTSALQI